MSDRRLRRWGVALAVVGAAIAAYLVFVHYSGVAPICSVSGGCEKVQDSAYSQLAGIPVAVLGLAGYVSILVATLLRSESAALGACAMTLIGVGFSGWLTYVELVEIHAICQWCVASAVTMALLCGVTLARAIRL